MEKPAGIMVYYCVSLATAIR